jgi:hypothetical protein
MANDVVLIEFKAKTDKFTAESKAVTDSINKSDAAVKKFEKDASHAYDKAGASANKASSSMKQTGQSFNQLGAGIQQAVGAMGLALGAQQLINFGKESVKAFMEAEVNAKKLAFAVKNIAGESEASFNRLIGQSAKLQENSIFSDDDIQRAQTALLQYGLTTDQVEKLVPAIVDLASATGEDLSSAQDRVLNGINGQTKGLKDVGLQFKDTGDKTKNFAIILDGINNKFAGATADALNTTDGKLKNLNNQFGELQETLGGELVPLLSNLIEGINAFSAGDPGKGISKITDTIQVGLPFIQEIKEAYEDFANGDFWDGLGNSGEAVVSLLTFGFYTRIKNYFQPAAKMLNDGYTDFEKAKIKVVLATDKEIQAQIEAMKAQGQSTAEFEKYVNSVRESNVTAIFDELTQTLQITTEAYKELTDISDKYGISARINASLIGDISKATNEDLEAAFTKFNGTLGVTRKDFEDYISKVKKIPPVHKELGDSLNGNIIGPYDALSKKLSEINKKILDYITSGKDATQLDRIRYELQKQLNEVTEEKKRLDESHNPIAKDNSEINKKAAENLTLLGTAALGTLEPTKQLPFNIKAITEASKEQAPTIEDLNTKLQDAANIAGALADLGQALNNALSQIFGEAAEKNAIFAGFQKAITIATITFKSFEAIANGIVAISSGDPTKIISGIAGIVAGIGNLIGGIISQVNATPIPKAPTFYEGTHDTGTGGNVDSKGGFWSILHPHEGVLNRDANSVFSPFVKAANAGEGMSYIKDNWIAPALKAHEEQMKNDFASNIATSLMFNGFDDYRLARLATEGNGLLKENNQLLAKSLRMKNPWVV